MAVRRPALFVIEGSSWRNVLRTFCSTSKANKENALERGDKSQSVSKVDPNKTNDGETPLLSPIVVYSFNLFRCFFRDQSCSVLVSLLEAQQCVQWILCGELYLQCGHVFVLHADSR